MRVLKIYIKQKIEKQKHAYLMFTLESIVTGVKNFSL